MGRESYIKVRKYQQMLDNYRLESKHMNDILFGEGNPHGVPTGEINNHSFSAERSAFKTFAIGVLLSKGLSMEEIIFTEEVEDPARADQINQIKDQVAAEMGKHLGKETLDDDDKKWLADFTLTGRRAVMNAVDRLYDEIPGKSINEFLGRTGIFLKILGTSCKDYYQEMDRVQNNFIYTEEQKQEYDKYTHTVNSMSSSARYMAESMEGLSMVYEPPLIESVVDEHEREYQRIESIGKGVGQFWKGQYLLDLWQGYRQNHPGAKMSDFCSEFASESVIEVPVQEAITDTPENGKSGAEYLFNNRSKRHLFADALVEGGLTRKFEVEAVDMVVDQVSGKDVLGKSVLSVNLDLDGKNLFTEEGLRVVKSTDFDKISGPSEGAYYQTTKYLPDNIVVKTSKLQMPTVGGKLSTRIPLKFTDERGNTVLGYFTENTLIGNSRDVTTNYYQKEHAKQKKGRNINVRNNMMYDYAKLLGMEHLVAKSHNMTIETLDGPLNGTFMKQAEGMTYDQLPKSGGKLRFTGEALKQISNMQILDYLSGNVDRHSDNLLYQTEMGKDGILYVTGVMGIDDDASFGKIKSGDSHFMQDVRGCMSTIDDIKIIDRELADSVMKMDQRELRKILHMGNLSHGEFEAAMERFDALKTKIEKGKVEILDGDKAWKTYNIRPLCQPIEKVKYTTEGRTFATKASNIWTIMGTVQNSFNREKVDKKASAEELIENYADAVNDAQDAAEDKSMVLSDNMSLGGHLSSQADHLMEIDDCFVGTDISDNSDEFNLMYAGLKGLQRYCRNLENRDFDEQPYTDKEMNDLTTLFETTRNLANNYIIQKGNPWTDRGKERLALAKNLSVYCNEMKHKAFENMREAEMVSITKQASEIAKTMIDTKAAEAAKKTDALHAGEERLIDEEAVQQQEQAQQQEKAKPVIPGLS